MSVIAAAHDLLIPPAPPKVRPRPAPPHADPSFRLIAVSLGTILPLAAARRLEPFFVAVGFEGPSAAALRAAFERLGVAGLVPAAAATPATIAREAAQLSGCEAAQRFDCLSLLGTAAGRRCLDTVLDGRSRPALIHCADRESFADWPALRAGLKARRYHTVGELSGAEMLIDGALIERPEARPLVASFDVFETLVAWRCGDRAGVFERVGELAGVPDFALQRRAAEECAPDGAVLADLYDDLARHYGWDAARRRAVEAIERQCATKMAIPVAENLGKVRDGDLLISDLPLDADLVRAMLAKAGLAKHVGLVAEGRVASSGRVWSRVAEAVRIDTHLGADLVGAPAEITARRTEAGGLTEVERTLDVVGLRDLARLCREARLATWHDDPGLRDLQLVQVSLNLPLLMLASVRLSRMAREHKARTVLFASPGGGLWQSLFEAFASQTGLRVASRTLLTGPRARRDGGEAYLDYARQSLAPESVVADLAGDPGDVARLGAQAGRAAAGSFALVGPSAADARAVTMLHAEPAAAVTLLRLANAPEHGPLAGMARAISTFVPRFATPARTAALREAIRVQHAAFACAVALLPHYRFADAEALDDESLALVGQALLGALGNQTGAARRLEECAGALLDPAAAS